MARVGPEPAPGDDPVIPQPIQREWEDRFEPLPIKPGADEGVRKGGR